MKATDLIKSITLSGLDLGKLKVVTLYKNQDPTSFLVDNFDNGRVIGHKNIQPLTILDSQDFLVIYGPYPLITPDNKSTFVPDCIYEINGGGYILLYAFN